MRDSLAYAEPLAVMINSGRMNGVPGHADANAIKDLLQTQLNYSGVIISDYDDWFRIATRHHYANSIDEAVVMAIDAGLDVHLTETLGENTMRTLYRLVSTGKISERRIDESVQRILTLKQKIGLLDGSDATGAGAGAAREVWSKSSRDISAEIAKQSITLLINRADTLPLKRGDARQRILVTGPTADSVAALCGGWLFNWYADTSSRMQGLPCLTREGRGVAEGSKAIPMQHVVTLLDGVRQIASEWQWEVVYERGCQLTTCSAEELGKAIAAARRADVIIVGVGEGAYVEFQDAVQNLCAGNFFEKKLTGVQRFSTCSGRAAEAATCSRWSCEKNHLCPALWKAEALGND